MRGKGSLKAFEAILLQNQSNCHRSSEVASHRAKLVARQSSATSMGAGHNLHDAFHIICSPFVWYSTCMTPMPFGSPQISLYYAPFAFVHKFSSGYQMTHQNCKQATVSQQVNTINNGQTYRQPIRR